MEPDSAKKCIIKGQETKKLQQRQFPIRKSDTRKTYFALRIVEHRDGACERCVASCVFRGLDKTGSDLVPQLALV